MKNRYLSVFVVSTLCASSNVNAFETGDVIGFDPGVTQCKFQGTYPDNCLYGLTNVTSGSYFAMDTNGNGQIDDPEKVAIAPGLDGGIIVGLLQPSLHAMTACDSTEAGTGPIDSPWCFGGNYGVHHTPTLPVIDNGDGTLDFSGWTVRWGGGDISTDVFSTVFTCTSDPCLPEHDYIIDVIGYVSDGWVGIPYELHLINGDPTAYITILDPGSALPGAVVQECNSTGGNLINLSTQVDLAGEDQVSHVEWFVNDQLIASGNAIQHFFPLGTQTISVRLTTLAGQEATDSMTVTIRDTTPPLVNADFINRVYDQSLEQLEFINFLRVVAQATDICDPSPVVQAMYGAPVKDNDSILVLQYSSFIILDTPLISLNVQATDSAANSASASRNILIQSN